MVKSRSQALTWLRGDFLRLDSVHITTCFQLTTPTGPPLAANDVTPARALARATPRSTERPIRALARATPRSVVRALARATPRKWPGPIPLLTRLPEAAYIHLGKHHSR
jgi:hypothetical protein